jgi:hypothetical protein
MKVLLYGNCQCWAIKETLQFPNNTQVTYISCQDTDIVESDFNNLVSNSDIIVTQPIRDDYRNSTHLSTSYVIATAKKTCTIFIFDSCYFDFYYFDLLYYYHNGDVLNEPFPYHYGGLLHTFKNSLSIDYYVEQYVENKNLKSKDELEDFAKKSLEELYKRYQQNIENYGMYKNVCIISTHDFIKENYTKILLFYSMNHPTKHLIQYICLEIQKQINIECAINYSADVLGGSQKSILYSCIQQMVEFNIRDYPPFCFNETTVTGIGQVYYEAYKKIFH